MTKVVTIGVYGFDADSFLKCLRQADVSVLMDVRQRRGVRGHEYAWANSQRLQAALADAGIAYEHHTDLAPTTDMRQAQYAEDDRLGVGKRSRQVLSDSYARRYTAEILAHADLAPIATGDGVAALFCVEADAEACHRSLVAERLAKEFGVTVEHLHPA
ncbi:DUF488 domain-containing protein [Lentzea sp. NPDC051838]|uniref:DUF488 domain-containing protein n=1 Tax=Lentzea sp. NPDC051838 TaxID=3154849 RepID=UPI003431BAB8